MNSFSFPPFWRWITCFTVLGASAPTAASADLRLDYLPVVFYQFTGVGMAWIQEGRFDTYRGLQLQHGKTVTVPLDFPDAAFDRPIIAETDWEAFGRLSPDALKNFALIPEAGSFLIDGRIHRAVRLATEANLSTGRVLNLSTRAWVGSGEAIAVGGLVIEDRPRTVLIRGVGPTLGLLGITNPVADPFITVFKGKIALYESTNWGDGEKPQKVAAAEIVQAFPLTDGSKDAALLIELGPGSYTVHMGVETGAPGIGLLEIYVLPDSTLLW